MFFKLNSYQKGICAEFYVLLFYLVFKRVVLLKWRYRTRVGEVDLVLKRANVIIFVEVKYRKSKDLFDVVDDIALKRMQNTVQIFLKSHKNYNSYQVRVDVCYVDNRLRIRQKQNIFC